MRISEIWDKHKATGWLDLEKMLSLQALAVIDYKKSAVRLTQLGWVTLFIYSIVLTLLIKVFLNKKTRNIWKNIVLALGATPMVALAVLLITSLIGALDDAITKIQSAGYWWVILIVGFALSLIYFIYEPKIRLNRERNKAVDALVEYWREQRALRKPPEPSKNERKSMHQLLLQRVKIWAFFDAELWANYFPEKYPKTFFGIVDNLMEDYDNSIKSKDQFKDKNMKGESKS